MTPAELANVINLAELVEDEERAEQGTGMAPAWHACDVTAPDSRLARYEARTDAPLLVLSVCFIAVYSLEVAARDYQLG
jgi:hypothetical protein